MPRGVRRAKPASEAYPEVAEVLNVANDDIRDAVNLLNGTKKHLGQGMTIRLTPGGFIQVAIGMTFGPEKGESQ